ncbi:capsular exopolysaccharide family domain protein [Lyngbya aestuarii BL J]|uniref:non-specific protein-tyrosine kinase n=1 Tax=Lyngbya aestuarii BL J TaxID=1348334 RepID=U7QFF4_9CYAN|nr:polysaccharide biosynthesis tyrosine autokinase [Lyngbya aestuarii]ERT05815.1 capsular exopolysaccharide family domain protein [Lyngbya aestuarii BL J]
MNTGKNSQVSVFHPQNKAQNLAAAYPLEQGAFGYQPEFYSPSQSQPKNKFWKGIWRRAILILGITAATTSGAYLWTNHQTPEYRGSFQLFIPSDSDSETGETFLEESKPELSYASQVKLLQSPKLMSGIIETIKTRYPEINYSALFNQKTGQTALEPDKLSITPIPDTRILEVSYRDTEPQKVQFILENIAKSYLDSSRTEERFDPNQEQLKLINNQLNPLQSRVEAIKKELLNLQNQYTFITPEIKTKQLTEQISQLEVEKLETRAQLEQQKASYLMMQQQLGLQPEQAMLASALSQSPRYQALLQKLLELETNIAIESARFTSKAPQIQALLDQRQRILPLLSEEAERVLGQDLSSIDPQILSFQDSIRMGLIQQLVTTANQISMLEIRTQVLDKAAQQLNESAQGFPAVMRRYSDLEQELEVATSRLNDLSLRRQELQLKVAPPPPPAWELIAEPSIPRNQQGELISVYPIVPLNLALGGLAGIVLGVAAAQLVERLDNVFHNTNEVTDRVPFPLLGVIPASNEALMLPAATMPRVAVSTTRTYEPSCTPFQEAFRSLSANIRCLNPESPVRSCVISSATPADGKSTVAMNLAMGAAAMGQRVLLVDADLRQPKVHRILQLSNDLGLSDVLIQNLEIQDVVQQTLSDENLFVLTAGKPIADPTRLLSSASMQALMGQLTEVFDLVIYDTAPLLGLADANLLAPNTNGLMMVVGVGKTDRAAVDLALRELQMAGGPVLGMVANGDKQERKYYAAYY